jgi:hypothetical protein
LGEKTDSEPIAKPMNLSAEIARIIGRGAWFPITAFLKQVDCEV